MISPSKECDFSLTRKAIFYFSNSFRICVSMKWSIIFLWPASHSRFEVALEHLEKSLNNLFICVKGSNEELSVVLKHFRSSIVSRNVGALFREMIVFKSALWTSKMPLLITWFTIFFSLIIKENVWGNHQCLSHKICFRFESLSGNTLIPSPAHSLDQIILEIHTIAELL